MNATSIILIAWLSQELPPTTVQEQQKAAARELVDQASAFYEKGDYLHALEKFNAAYATYASPKLWFNIGQANRDLGRHVEALEAFERFLAAVPDALPKHNAEAQAAVDEYKRNLGQLSIDCYPTGARISIDGREVGLAPLTRAIWLVPADHQLTATHAGAIPGVENVAIHPGERRTVVIRLQAAATPAEQAAPARPVQVAQMNHDGWWLGRKWTWIAAGSTLVLAGGATTFSLLVDAKRDELNRSCGSTPDPTVDCDNERTIHRDRQAMANLFWGATAATAVTAGLLYFFEARPVAIVPMVASRGFEARVQF